MPTTAQRSLPPRGVELHLRKRRRAAAPALSRGERVDSAHQPWPAQSPVSSGVGLAWSPFVEAVHGLHDGDKFGGSGAAGDDRRLAGCSEGWPPRGVAVGVAFPRVVVLQRCCEGAEAGGWCAEPPSARLAFLEWLAAWLPTPPTAEHQQWGVLALARTTERCSDEGSAESFVQSGALGVVSTLSPPSPV